MQFNILSVLLVALAMWYQIFWSGCTFGQDTEASQQGRRVKVRSLDSHGPYCGIYSIVAASSAFGKEVPIEALWRPDIVSDDNGSSADNILAGLTIAGLSGVCHASLSWLDLKLSTNPMILHYRSAIGGKDFDHWVTVMRADNNGGFILYDPPFPAEETSLQNLMANWDGFAIEVTQSGDSIDSSLNWTSVSLTVFSFFIVLFAVAEKYSGSALSLTQRLVILSGVLFGFGTLYDWICPTSLLRNQICTAAIKDRFFGSDFGEVSLAELQTHVKNGAVLIDVRTASSFARGSIPEAISLPVNSSLQYREEVLYKVDLHKLIVVFCQSRECGYAERMARFLQFNGYTNILLYKNGFTEWEKRTNGA